MSTRLVICLLFALGISSVQAQQVVPLYAGAPPGSENWNWQEKQYFSKIFNTEIVYNVVRPTLTLYKPDSVAPNGTAAVICPGGVFHVLSINSEGVEVARWLAKRGVMCFVLKYRVIHSVTDDPVKELLAISGDTTRFNRETDTIVPLGIADTRAAIAYVRNHASEWGVDKSKIGVIGFSAGGTMAESAAFQYSPDNKPDFVAPIYSYVPPGQDLSPAADAPPMFLVAATDDQLHLVPCSLALYNAYLAKGKSVELHLYARGGHGFGMRKQYLTSDTWMDRLGDWLTQLGYIKK